jgi:hypothetical protein
MAGSVVEPTRHSTRSSEQLSIKRWSPSPPPDEMYALFFQMFYASLFSNFSVLVYPPSGIGALNLTYADVKRLDPHKFLNDVLIEFGLKCVLWPNNLILNSYVYIGSGLMSYARTSRNLQSRYTSLVPFFLHNSTNKSMNDYNYCRHHHCSDHSPSIDEGYSSVRRWTSKFDLFDKKFLIIPINEEYENPCSSNAWYNNIVFSLHWYLAIICYPGRTLQHAPKPDDSVSKVSICARTRSEGQTATFKQSRPPNRPPYSHGSAVMAETDKTKVEKELESRLQPSTNCRKMDASLDEPVGARQNKLTHISPDTFYANLKTSNKSDVSKDLIASHLDEEEEANELADGDQMEVDTPPLESDKVFDHTSKLERYVVVRALGESH